MKEHKIFRHFLLLSIFIVLLACSCAEEQYTKTKALEQISTSLNVGYETYLTSDSINSLLSKVKDKSFNSKDIKGIYDLSKKLVKKTEGNINLLATEKKEHKVTSLYESTIDYLESVKLFENNIPVFIKSIVDSTLFQKMELNKRIGNLAIDVKNKGENWQNSKIDFYKIHKIEQKAIDSIEKLIMKK